MIALGDDHRLDMLKDVQLDVSAEISGARIEMSRLLELGAGSIIEFEHRIDSPVDLIVNGRVVARGEIVAVGDNYGLRITELARGDHAKR